MWVRCGIPSLKEVTDVYSFSISMYLYIPSLKSKINENSNTKLTKRLTRDGDLNFNYEQINLPVIC